MASHEEGRGLRKSRSHGSILNGIAAGQFVPYSSYSRQLPPPTAPSSYIPESWSYRAAPPTEMTHSMWLSRHQVGTPNHTGWTINERGNRVWMKFEPFTPTLFPVKETRFYKPKLHRMDFLQKRTKNPHGSRYLF
ncbi:hypothetical protein TCAL_01580 [Tigriopus californicus]|uniref:Uncharacterized protein n=1 Tax=Tigriopus californicus TaxID=6832 RepID=A0A553P8R7_TIGCA|nr:uncharacterized protein LOC131878341 [Tigriopus californicus]TRY74084.1 hypothetical protein TCAL_01580 [Tigriopus californicus]|eukprot:TCALIF_01580-PA protein Name:"Protein of unknown function" AED:0.00 eAED:0.00 QI:188/1/1/1/0/1/2/113/134